jgi:hypothetical protein
MEAVGEIESERDENDEDDKGEAPADHT